MNKGELLNAMADGSGLSKTDAERALAQIWADVLAVPLPGIDDNFFALGGDSILSLQVVARARAQDLPLSPRQLLLEPTIRQLAAALGTAATEEEAAAAGPLPATPIQRWFAGLELLEPGVVPLPLWRPDGPVPNELTVGHRLMYGGIARKP